MGYQTRKKWNGTIGDKTFPGAGVKVYYKGWLATPEELGNYTYAHIGHALGFFLPELYAGSWYAAGCPLYGSAFDNEVNDDWPAIKKGYDSYE